MSSFTSATIGWNWNRFTIRSDVPGFNLVNGRESGVCSSGRRCRSDHLCVVNPRPAASNHWRRVPLASQKYANLIESLAGLETVKLFQRSKPIQFRWEEAPTHMAKTGTSKVAALLTAGFCSAKYQRRYDHFWRVSNCQRKANLRWVAWLLRPCWAAVPLRFFLFNFHCFRRVTIRRNLRWP